MNATRKILLLLSFISSYYVCSQNNQNISEIDKPSFTLNPWDNINGLRVATNFVSDYEAEASYLITSYPKMEPGFGAMAMRVQYIGLGIEYLNIDRRNFMGFKASYEESFALFSGQLGFDYLTDFNDSQFRFTPKIGASIFGFLTLYYGWNFNLNKSSTIQPREQFLSLQLNMLE
jgi:hypothetical protein